MSAEERSLGEIRKALAGITRRLDALADPSSLGDLNEDDPQSVARWMKKMGSEMGEDLGDDVDEALEEEASSDLETPSETGGGGDEL